MESLNTFAELLSRHMEAFHWGLDRLADASDVSKTTLAGWRSQGKLPRDWQNVVRVANAFGLDHVQTNELLAAAHCPSLEKLNGSSLKAGDRALLDRWATVISQPDVVSLQPPRLLVEEMDQEGEKENSRVTAGSNKNTLSLYAIVTITTVSMLGVIILSFALWQLTVSPSNLLQSLGIDITGEQTSGTWPSGAIRLVEQPLDSQLHLELADSRIITTGGAIRAGEIVTISFVIRNEFTDSVGIKQLRAGGRLGHTCMEENATKWSGLPVEFSAVTNLVLRPGEEYRYTSSRQYSQAGVYFIEPVRQDANNRWGGFAPSACIALLVTQ